MKCPIPFLFMCFTLSSTLWDLFNERNGTVFFHGVSTLIEVFSHWFLYLHVSDVISVTIEADVQDIFCWTDVMFVAFLALYQVDHTLWLTGGRCAHLVGFSRDNMNASVVLMCQQVLQPLLVHGLFPFVLVPMVMETDIFFLPRYFFFLLLYTGGWKWLTWNKDLVTIALVQLCT